jgi:hypothetical protein
MGSLVPHTQNTNLASRPHRETRTAIQLDLVLDDERLRGITPAERQAALRTLARLLLEAGGVAAREVDDDHA